MNAPSEPKTTGGARVADGAGAAGTEARPQPREVKSALRKSPLAEPFLASRFSFSPYMACGHGCAYCDGRAERYFVEGEFDRDIVVRENVAEVLDAELGRLRERAAVSVGSGISDAYQPVEERIGLMRRCAEVLLKHRYPVSILTKSARILRDLDIWSALNREAGFNLYVSLIHTDDEVRRVFEPGASSVEERLGALRAFKAAGCATGVYAMPLLPWITDTQEQVERLLGMCRDAGVDFVIPGGLTLRPGRQKEFFFARLRRFRPELLRGYEELFGENRPSGACRASYAREHWSGLARAVERVGLPVEIPHRLYRARMPLYDELHLLLCHMDAIYERRGADVTKLRAAASRYREWLVERKRLFNRRRRETQRELESELREELDSGGLARRIGNEKLAGFLREVASGKLCFNYVSLKLESAG